MPTHWSWSHGIDLGSITQVKRSAACGLGCEQGNEDGQVVLYATHLWNPTDFFSFFFFYHPRFNSSKIQDIARKIEAAEWVWGQFIASSGLETSRNVLRCLYDQTMIANKLVLSLNDACELNGWSEYIDLDRKDAANQWAQLKKDNPYGFDVVVEATGVESIVNDSINYVRRGGTLSVYCTLISLLDSGLNLSCLRSSLVYGVYDNAARVSWSPTKIFSDEINIVGSFSQT